MYKQINIAQDHIANLSASFSPVQAMSSLSALANLQQRDLASASVFASVLCGTSEVGMGSWENPAKNMGLSWIIMDYSVMIMEEMRIYPTQTLWLYIYIDTVYLGEPAGRYRQSKWLSTLVNHQLFLEVFGQWLSWFGLPQLLVDAFITVIHTQNCT